MKIKTAAPAFVGLAALLGAVLRGLNLMYGYEEGTRLPVPGDPAETGLIALSALAAVLLLAAALRCRRYRGIAFEEAFCSGGALFKMLSVLTGLVMIAAGGAGLYTTAAVFSSGDARSTLPMIPLWLLAMLTGGSFIGTASAISRRKITESAAALTIVPMFWACFDLIITFKDNGASPFVGLYGFELLAAIALTYAFYSLAGFLYSTASPSRFVFSAGLAAVLCIAVVGGAFLSILSGSSVIPFPAETLLRYACFLASGVWLFALLVLLSRSLAGKE